MSNMIHPNMLAVSRAGHDKDKLYLILKEEDGYCYLVDGEIRKIDHPKKKKRMHLQVICHLSDEIKAMMAEIKQDDDIRKILKTYNRTH